MPIVTCMFSSDVFVERELTSGDKNENLSLQVIYWPRYPAHADEIENSNRLKNEAKHFCFVYDVGHKVKLVTAGWRADMNIQIEFNKWYLRRSKIRSWSSRTRKANIKICNEKYRWISEPRKFYELVWGCGETNTVKLDWLTIIGSKFILDLDCSITIP